MELKISKLFSRFKSLSTPKYKMPQYRKNFNIIALPDPIKPGIENIPNYKSKNTTKNSLNQHMNIKTMRSRPPATTHTT